ncbi:hypothetical protein J2Z22_003365 [Paenibacillus forsythiae]|uniref:Lipoprotein n=1 Tax=Paenibacillus forsythiae TaxID=365616 RepID=A0ABU3HAF0_9BACL|nr:hypothetical protein [Paenibacillus forsythiae]MDT3427789.1 hypothetical protein [Paenibacillus forsythiae]
MKKQVIWGLIIATSLVSGCSAKGNNQESSPTAAIETEKPRKLSDSEKIALEYVTVFLNGTDLEAKKKFVADNIYPDVQPIFQLAASQESTESSKLHNPKVLESKDYTDKEGGKNKIVLIEGEKSSVPKSELIILIKNNKIGWATGPSNKETFDVIRKEFAHPIPSSSPAESAVADTKEKLKEIRNFTISDIWNSGFVDINWFIGSGTNSTGESMDIDFAMEQLGKTMDKKKEYDQYVEGLPSEYDSLKSIWTKLSGEADRMYQQLQTTPPKANDKNGNLDAGKLNQYLEAFDKAVSELTES